MKASLPSADARLIHIGSIKYFTLHTFLKIGSLLRGKKFTVISHIQSEHTVSHSTSSVKAKTAGTTSCYLVQL